MRNSLLKLTLFFTVFFQLASDAHLRAEAMLQYFNTDWSEITDKIPELSEAGYTSLWLPPPTKGSGGLSVGYDLWDRFDLGSKDQRGSVRTRYGTEAELLQLVETAHRFGIRIYFDNIVNHNAFDIPGYNADTPIDIYPGLFPEDFHLRVTEDGFYRKWDNTRNWGDAWQVMNLGLADLIDLAQEPGGTNLNFGTTEGSLGTKIKLLRNPDNPEYYCYLPNGTYVGFGSGNGITKQMLQDNTSFYSERVEDYLDRSVRWLMDRTKADGLRLDAVKHVRADFFGATYGADKDSSDYGYLGQMQRQFNISRGFSDANHRDTVFDTEAPRDDAMVFGEHLGEPPGYGPYIDAGMRLVDNPLRQNLNDKLGSPWNGLEGYDQPGAGGFSPGASVMHAQSHDNDYASRRELQHAFYFTRAGMGLIYTDGNHHAETLGDSGGAFPRHANTAFLGQWNDSRIPNLLYINGHFARGYQVGRWSDSDFVAYERIDKRENPSMTDADGVTMLMMLNDNYSNGLARNFTTNFPSQGGTQNDAYLFNYSTYGGGFFKYASQLSSVVVPPGGYFVFSWRSPEESDLWRDGGGKPVTILQDGQAAPLMSYQRKDGPDGDPAYNPYGLPDTNQTDYAYTMSVPRITSGTNVSFIARSDGSAEDILFKLDGGMDLNGLNNALGDPRDNPPALATDVFLGYESTLPANRVRQGAEKFGAVNSVRNKMGSAGAETYRTVIGSGTVAVSNGSATNDFDTWGGTTPSFVYHDPVALVEGTSTPPTHYRENANSMEFWAKTNPVGNGYKGFVYYTTDGSYPEGAGGVGIGTTKVAELHYQFNGGDGNNWWQAEVSPKVSGTLTYKLSLFKNDSIGSVFPSNETAVYRKRKMLTTYAVPGFNLDNAVFRPHADYGATQVGLSEGFHVIRARAFLGRAGRASIYNTFTQTFYYDAQPPAGEIKYPQPGDTLGDQEYGVVVRTDPSVTEVWYHIDDSNSANDDVTTGVANGNGNGFEPYTDTNHNGAYDAGEPFEDVNGNGSWDSSIGSSWIKATSLTPNSSVSSAFQKEWRFKYSNIPSTGTAQIKVRLRELSSASRSQFVSEPGDAAGHYTTLVCNVTTAAPPIRMFIAYPQADGETIGTDYKVKVWFSKSLSEPGLSTSDLIDRFLVKLASSESGSLSGAVAQARSNYQVNYDVTPEYHELQFPKNGVSLPNLYNGVADFLHTIQVTYTKAGSPALSATRQVKFRPVQAGPYVNIANPPEVDSDGKRFQIVLPDVTAPTPEQRQYPIRVETDLNAKSVWIDFLTGSGSAALSPSSETALSGTLQFTSGSTVVSGTGTAFDQELGAGNVLRANGTLFNVAVVNSATSLTLSSSSAVTFCGTATRVDPNPHLVGNRKVWDFVWSNITEGTFTFTAHVDTDGQPATSEADATRNGSVVFRQQVAANPSDTDDDDDGLLDSDETTAQPLPNQRPSGSTPAPKPNPETWTNGEVHVYYAFGRTNPLSPDSDGDGLPDGLEVGWRGAANGDTNLSADTNGDGTPNFVGDLDPPFYNTLDNYGRVPNVNSASEGGDRAKQVAGSTTDPNNPDSDGDGILDGVEDANHNGWIDGEPFTDTNGNGIHDAGEPFVDLNRNGIYDTGDGEPLPLNWDPYLSRNWPNGKRDPNEYWTETDPNNPDTDGDGLLDGYGEDKNFNGRIDGDTNNNRIYDAGEAWTETDPLNPDTDGDGLPDGWERAHGLDPLDNGVDNLATSAPNDGHVSQGASGDPDGDGFTNLQEYSNGTDPNVPDTGAPPAPGTITIGPVPESQKVTVGGVTNYREFTDWTADDLIALDEYEGDGTNNQQGDIYPAYDGYDSSRDLVAFYAHDGGDVANGGDGQFYFRVDMADLRPYAEQANLDIYVVVDTNSPSAGEHKLPDDVDTLTNMGWEAVVACYSTNNGRVYIDTNRATANNTTSLSNDLNDPQFGVVARDQNSPNGFRRAYFNSDLDAVEFSISRQALIDAGWNGLNAAELNFQVFTTKDGTQNSPTPGAGDIGGRSDIRDSIADDWIAEDYYNAQSGIAGAKSVLYSWVGKNATNDSGKRVKVVSLIHGNQPIQPGSTIQGLINTGSGSGFYRPLDVHQAYGVPFALHITPTLASAIQWAQVDPASPRAYRDGPAFNARLRTMANSNPQVVDILGSTFSDHMLPYFPTALNLDNVQLASELLTGFYGTGAASKVFWTPERVSDSGVLGKVQALGYSYTFVDQMRHIWKWFGRSSALGDDGYRIQSINGVQCMVINDQASNYRFQNTDNGLPGPLRELFSRKARSGRQDQVIVLYSDWSDFTDKAQADAYDKNIRWIASHPWIELITPDQIANQQVDLSVPADGTGDSWPVKDRGTGLTLAKVQPDWLDHATEENYDNWYFGNANEEGLSGKVFNIRQGTAVPKPFGFLDSNTPSGMVADAWARVSALSLPGSSLGKLARGTAHASLFITAFHDQANNDLSKFSTGAYISPDTDALEPISGFARNAQSQIRFAAQYSRVQSWAAAAASGAYSSSSVAEQADVDLDGEPEYLIYNDRIFAVFERLGGRMIGAWVRDIETGQVLQAVGNPLAYSGSDTEEEGTANVVSGQVGAFRTSAFKDWFAQTGTSGAGTGAYVNDLFSAAPAATGTGWKFTSADGAISKTVTLSAHSTLVKAAYQLSGAVNTVYVRAGLSPNLFDLLQNGQGNLVSSNDPVHGEYSVVNNSPTGGVRTFVRYGNGFTANYNPAATDRDGTVTWDTLAMRNQAQTQQVEISGTNGLSFAIGIETGATLRYDADGDGLPDYWQAQYGLPSGSADADPDHDGFSNAEEWVLGSNPIVADSRMPAMTSGRDASGFPTISWSTLPDRLYRVSYRTSLNGAGWTAVGTALVGTGGTLTWTDNGTETGSDPRQSGARFYRVTVSRPAE